MKPKEQNGSSTHQRIPAPQLLARERPALLIDQLKRTADLRPSDALRSLSGALALHPLLLVLEVPDEPGAREDEQQPGLPRERARPVPAPRLLYRLRLVPALLVATARWQQLAPGASRGRGGYRAVSTTRG